MQPKKTVRPKKNYNGSSASAHASYDALDEALLAGFVTPEMHLPYQRRKIAAIRLRARIVAVDAWISTGARLAHRELAQRLEISDRSLSDHFPTQSGLYAFPPPELAISFSAASIAATTWSDIAKLVTPVIEALDSNPQARTLLAGLVVLHRAHDELSDTDNYFAHALRDALQSKRHPSTLAIVGLFTEGLRAAFNDWVDAGEPSFTFVADRVTMLLVGPVQSAFEALELDFKEQEG